MPQLGERGAVTAEFAVALPAVLLVLALGAGVLGSVATTVRAQQMTAEAARLSDAVTAGRWRASQRSVLTRR